MPEFYDPSETRDEAARAASIAESLPRLIGHARANAPYYARSLADVDASTVTSRAALAALPLVRKADLPGLQAGDPPFGGLVAVPTGQLARVFMSPGPIYEPEAHGEDPYRFGRAMFAAGFRPGELVHNTFAYHLTPAGRLVEGGAHALGCPVFPAGVGNTEQQVRAMADLKPKAYVGTPSFLRILLDKAAELGVDVSSVDKALVSGEALPASLRADLGERGVAVYQCYATADLGLIAYESHALEGLISDEGAIIEIVRPGTGDPVAEGEVGEVVVTVFNPAYPLIRFATGDLSAVLPGPSPCGRTNLRIRGWMGRADQTTKVKGMFVHPSQVAEVLSRHPQVGRGRLEVTGEAGRDTMTLVCETAAANAQESTDALADALRGSLQDVTKLRGEVRFVAEGTLPNDGKVIDDQRSYE